MKIETIKCDECGREKAEANHWQQIWVETSEGSYVRITLGVHPIGQLRYESRDLCGEQCFHKHIAKLLKMPTAPAQE